MKSGSPHPAPTLLQCHPSPPSPCPSPALALYEEPRTSSLEALRWEGGGGGRGNKTQLCSRMMENRTKRVRKLQQETLGTESGRTAWLTKDNLIQ